MSEKKKLKMKRDEWELIREYRKAPIRKKYKSLLKKKEKNKESPIWVDQKK
ncbi:MAG: hypothetical protein ACFFAH_06540 [Promethearchaeota archaeon]